MSQEDFDIITKERDGKGDKIMPFKNVRIGDKVWAVNFGWGEIFSIGILPDLPVRVRFNTYDFKSYTWDGKQNIKDPMPILFREDLSRIAKERDQYRSIVEFIVSGDCPEHDETWNCVKNKTRCSDCLMDYARGEMEKIKENLTKEGEKE